MDQKKIVSFLAFWVANSVALLVSGLIFGTNVILGNDMISKPLSSVVCGLILTLSGMLFESFAKKSDFMKGTRLTLTSAGLNLKEDHIWGIFYLVVNFAVVFIIKRFSLVIGLGISNLLYVFLVSVVLTAFQWAAAAFSGAIAKK